MLDLRAWRAFVTVSAYSFLAQRILLVWYLTLMEGMVEIEKARVTNARQLSVYVNRADE